MVGRVDAAVDGDDPGSRRLQGGHGAQAAGMRLGRADVGDHGDVGPPGGHPADDVGVGQVVAHRVDQRDGGAAAQGAADHQQAQGVCVHDKLPPPKMSLDARAKIFTQHPNRSPCGSKPRGV